MDTTASVRRGDIGRDPVMAMITLVVVIVTVIMGVVMIMIVMMMMMVMSMVVAAGAGDRPTGDARLAASADGAH